MNVTEKFALPESRHRTGGLHSTLCLAVGARVSFVEKH